MKFSLCVSTAKTTGYKWSQIIKTQRCWLLNFPLAVFYTQNCFWQRRPLTQWPSVWNQSFTPIFFCRSAKGQSGPTSETSETSDAEQTSHQWVCLKKKDCSLHEAVTHMVRKQVLDPLCIISDGESHLSFPLIKELLWGVLMDHYISLQQALDWQLSVTKSSSQTTLLPSFIRFRLRWSSVS